MRNFEEFLVRAGAEEGRREGVTGTKEFTCIDKIGQQRRIEHAPHFFLKRKVNNKRQFLGIFGIFRIF